MIGQTMKLFYHVLSRKHSNTVVIEAGRAQHRKMKFYAHLFFISTLLYTAHTMPSRSDDRTGIAPTDPGQSTNTDEALMDWSSYSEEGSANGGDSDTAGTPSVMSTSSEDSGDMAIHGNRDSIDRCLMACDMILLDLKQRYKEHRRTPEWQEILRLEEVLEDLHFNLAAKSYAAQHVQRLNEVYVKGRQLLQQPYPGEDTEAIIGKVGKESVMVNSNLARRLEDCPICHHGFETDTKAVKWPGCGHTFHRTCLREWAHARKGETTCPICRRDTLGETSFDKISATF